MSLVVFFGSRIFAKDMITLVFIILSGVVTYALGMYFLAGKEVREDIKFIFAKYEK